MTDVEISYETEKGRTQCHNWQGSFQNSRREFRNHPRSCSSTLFYGRKSNGEQYNRDWLVYSDSTGIVYCFVCKLFGVKSTSSLANRGFSDWRNTSFLQAHAHGADHRTALLSYLTRHRGSGINSRLEQEC